MPETKHDLVALPKKLRPNLDRELKPFLPTYIRPQPSTSAQPGQSDALVVSSSHEDDCRKKVFWLIVKERPQRDAMSKEIP